MFDLHHYDAAVFDLDGTVWLSGEPIDGAAEYLDACRAAGITVAFATNITLTSVDDVRRDLLACGLARPGELVITAGVAVAATVAAAGVTEVAALCSPPLADALRARGVSVTPISEIDRATWGGPQPGRALVLAGWPEATLRQIEAMGQLAADGHPIYISSLDPGFPGRHGFEPGAGMMVAAARALHRFEPIVCGKPSNGYAAALRAELGAEARIVMFGDSQRADIGLAHLLEADGVLLVGEPAKAVADDLPAPTFVAPRLGAAVTATARPADTATTAALQVDKCQIYAQLDGFRPLELDLYRPADATGPLPVLVYVHGGGWRVSTRHSGPRETRGWSRSVFERWCDAGFAVAAVEYRYSAEALHPAPIDDVCLALDWLRGNAGEWGLDAGRMVLWGQSAGGHVAASAALRQPAGSVAAVICWYPLTALEHMGPHDDSRFAELYLGHTVDEDPEHARLASPAAHVVPGAPPFLLQHGTADVMAPYEQSVVLSEALRGAGVPVELEAVDGADHFFVGRADAEVEAIFERAVTFAQRYVSS